MARIKYISRREKSRARSLNAWKALFLRALQRKRTAKTNGCVNCQCGQQTNNVTANCRPRLNGPSFKTIDVARTPKGHLTEKKKLNGIKQREPEAKIQYKLEVEQAQLMHVNFKCSMRLEGTDLQPQPKLTGDARLWKDEPRRRQVQRLQQGMQCVGNSQIRPEQRKRQHKLQEPLPQKIHPQEHVHVQHLEMSARQIQQLKCEKNMAKSKERPKEQNQSRKLYRQHKDLHRLQHSMQQQNEHTFRSSVRNGSSNGSHRLTACKHYRRFKQVFAKVVPDLKDANTIDCDTALTKVIGQKRKRTEPLVCADCGRHDGRLHKCLHCKRFCCWPQHVKSHLVNGHVFAVDLERLRMFCAKCSGHVQIHGLERIPSNDADNDYAKAVDGQELQAKKVKTLKPNDVVLGIPRTVARGLENLGNTCYLNAVLQVFVNMPMLYGYFASGGHPQTSCPNQEKCMCCQMGTLLREMHSGSTAPHCPREFLRALRVNLRKNPQFQLMGNEQHDAHELYTALVEQLCTHSLAAPPSIGQSCGCFAHRLFFGQESSKCACSCGAAGENFVQTNCLQLPFAPLPHNRPKGPEESLEDCLRRYIKKERIHDYRCETCGARRTSTLQTTLSTTSPILTIALKRFDVFRRGQRKNRTPLRFPAMLDLREFSSAGQDALARGADLSSLSPLRYRLYAVIAHSGTLDQGHYRALIRRGNTWLVYSDELVRKVNWNYVAETKEEAYLLFYIRDGA